MGLFRKNSTPRCSIISSNSSTNSINIEVKVSPNPDPKNFEILWKYKSAKTGLVLMKVHYPDATSFEGNKLLIFKGDPKIQDSLDPHFFKDSKLLARFRPDNERAARFFVDNYKG